MDPTGPVQGATRASPRASWWGLGSLVRLWKGALLAFRGGHAGQQAAPTWEPGAYRTVSCAMDVSVYPWGHARTASYARSPRSGAPAGARVGRVGLAAGPRTAKGPALASTGPVRWGRLHGYGSGHGYDARLVSGISTSVSAHSSQAGLWPRAMAPPVASIPAR